MIHGTHAICKKKDQPPKTAAAVRDIDISEELAALLREYIASIPAASYLFATANGKPMSQRNVLVISTRVRRLGSIFSAASVHRLLRKSLCA